MTNRRTLACLPVVGLVGFVLSGCVTSPEPVAAEDTAAPAPVYVNIYDERIIYDSYPDAPAPNGDLSSVDWFNPQLELVVPFPLDINAANADVTECEALAAERNHLWVIDGPAQTSVLACVYAKGNTVLVLTREVSL